MKLYELGTVIAERQFSQASEDGVDRVASVKIGMPQRFPVTTDHSPIPMGWDLTVTG